MKLRFHSAIVVAAASFSIILNAPDVRAVITYDLKTDWSEVSNPNGVWSYREGTNALPHVASWLGDPAAFGTNVQPAWADSGVQASQEFLPAWFKSTFNPPS